MHLDNISDDMNDIRVLESVEQTLAVCNVVIFQCLLCLAFIFNIRVCHVFYILCLYGCVKLYDLWNISDYK